MKKRSKKKNIIEKIRGVMAEAGEVKPGFYHVEVLHDNDCPALKSERLVDCRCKPIIKRKRPDA